MNAHLMHMQQMTLYDCVLVSWRIEVNVCFREKNSQ